MYGRAPSKQKTMSLLEVVHRYENMTIMGPTPLQPVPEPASYRHFNSSQSPPGKNTTTSFPRRPTFAQPARIRPSETFGDGLIIPHNARAGRDPSEAVAITWMERMSEIREQARNTYSHWREEQGHRALAPGQSTANNTPPGSRTTGGVARDATSSPTKHTVAPSPPRHPHALSRPPVPFHPSKFLIPLAGTKQHQQHQQELQQQQQQLQQQHQQQDQQRQQQPPRDLQQPQQPPVQPSRSKRSLRGIHEEGREESNATADASGQDDCQSEGSAGAVAEERSGENGGGGGGSGGGGGGGMRASVVSFATQQLRSTIADDEDREISSLASKHSLGPTTHSSMQLSVSAGSNVDDEEGSHGLSAQAKREILLGVAELGSALDVIVSYTSRPPARQLKRRSRRPSKAKLGHPGF